MHNLGLHILHTKCAFCEGDDVNRLNEPTQAAPARCKPQQLGGTDFFFLVSLWCRRDMLDHLGAKYFQGIPGMKAFASGLNPGPSANLLRFGRGRPRPEEDPPQGAKPGGFGGKASSAAERLAGPNPCDWRPPSIQFFAPMMRKKGHCLSSVVPKALLLLFLKKKD